MDKLSVKLADFNFKSFKNFEKRFYSKNYNPMEDENFIEYSEDLYYTQSEGVFYVPSKGVYFIVFEEGVLLFI